VQPGGQVFVELEPANLTVYLETLDRHNLHVVEGIAWQKKYSGQNSRRDFENLHDYILIAQLEPSEQPVPITFLPFKVAGKSEDAVREFNELAIEALGDDALRAPEPLKPVALFQWLVGNRVDPSASLLDLTSCGASWSSQAAGICSSTVDVVWPDETWFEASWWLLSQRLSVKRDRAAAALSSIESTNVIGRIDCSCGLISRPPSRSRNPYARIGLPGDENADGPIEALSGRVEDLVDGLSNFLQGRVLDSFGSLTMLASCAEGLVDLQTPDGISALLMEDNWPRDLLGLVKAVGHAGLVGTLVLHSGDEVVGEAQALALMSTGVRRFRPHPLWSARSRQYSNADSDPRGPWRNPGHKGARSGGPGTSFRLFRPPYTWSVAGGSLPPGMWRLNPVSGVIWGSPTSLGSWTLEVEASDTAGNCALANVTFEVVAADDVEPVRADLSDCDWIFQPLEVGGPLKVKDRHVRLPIGLTASLVMKASGGSPCTVEVPPPGRALASGRTRYWEFSRDSLVSAFLEDRVLFPPTLSAKPSIRQYEPASGGRHAAMPSVMFSNGLNAKEFFWQRLSRRREGDIGLNWSGTAGDAIVRLVTDSPEGRRAIVTSCEACVATSRLGQGCSKEHAVQPCGALVRDHNSSEPQVLVDLSGHPVGVLFHDTPVSAESLQLLAIEGFSGKVLAVHCTARTDTDLLVEKVSWGS